MGLVHQKLSGGDDPVEKTRCIVARLLLSVMIFLSLAVFFQERSSAETMISSPIPSKGKGFREGMENWYVGAGYFEKKSEVRASDSPNDMKEDVSHLYGVLGYRFSPWTEAYLRVGSAEFNIDGDDADAAKLFATLGLDLKWYKAPSFSIWSSFQGNYYYPQMFSSANERIELNTADLTIAPIAADYKIPISSVPDLLTVYGGVLAKYTWADTTITNRITGLTSEGTLRDTSHAGLFAGLRVVPVKGLNIDVEGQYISRFSFGLNLVYAFPVDF
jgi:hypothetical protein